MITRDNWKATVGLATVLSLTLAASALAHGPSHAGFGASHAVPRAPGLLTQLIFPCQAACVTTARECDDTADSDALTCISAACSTEVSTAQTACATDRTSQACRDAITALQTCSDSCLTTRGTALTACRSALATCRTACAAE